MSGQPTGMLLLPVRHILRLVLEAVTPISLASGGAAGDRDVSLLRDWNGLPCLSGTSLVGVLRSLHRDHEAYYGKGATVTLFGHEPPRRQDGQASQLMVGFGLAIDAHGHAADGYRTPTEIAADPVLRLLASDTPILRDHVAIDRQGVAREHLKFDRTACPVGTRFAVDLYLDGETETITRDAERLCDIARLFAVPHARFGGAGRRGLGRLAIAGDGQGPLAYIATIDRRGMAGRSAWMAFHAAKPAQTDVAGFRRLRQEETTPPASTTSDRCAIDATLRIQASGYWRMGDGHTPWSEATDGAAAQTHPLLEPVIRWHGIKATVARQAVTPVPGSGVKGALAHRAEFHLRRIRGCFANDPTDGDTRLMDDILGRVLDGGGGNSGFLHIDDAVLDFSSQTNATGKRTRNSIDRHTGGVRLKKLFTDEALWKGPVIKMGVTLLTSRAGRDVPADAVTALDWAIDDLMGGRLALGARGATGDGTMGEGELVCRVGPATYPTFTEALRAIRRDPMEAAP